MSSYYSKSWFSHDDGADGGHDDDDGSVHDGVMVMELLIL